MPGWRLLAQAGARVLGCGARGLGADPGLERRWVWARGGGGGRRPLNYVLEQRFGFAAEG